MGEKLLTMKGITGILNGVEDIVRPDNAELGIKTTYDKTTLEKKTQVKTAMQKSLGFAVDASIPMFVFMGRLDAQKGVDVMFQSIEKALEGASTPSSSPWVRESRSSRRWPRTWRTSSPRTSRPSFPSRALRSTRRTLPPTSP